MGKGELASERRKEVINGGVDGMHLGVVGEVAHEDGLHNHGDPLLAVEGLAVVEALADALGVDRLEEDV
jgi:hypothetical protein